MFRFEEPTYLYLLLLLPFLAAFYLYSNYRRRKAIRKFGDPVLMAQLMPDVSKYRPDVKFWLVFAAIGLFAVLLARPQFGSKLEKTKLNVKEYSKREEDYRWFALAAFLCVLLEVLLRNSILKKIP